MRRSFNVACALAIGLTALFVILRLKSNEPTYAGHSLYWWLQKEDPQQFCLQPEARHAVTEMGTKAAPAIVKLLCSSDPTWKISLLNFFSRQSLAHIRLVSAVERRDAGLLGLGALRGAAMSEAVSELGAKLEQEENAEAACWLAATGTNGLPFLLHALTNNDEYVRYLAAGGFSGSGFVYLANGDKREGIPWTLQAFNYSEADIKDIVGVYSKFAIPALLVRLKDRDKHVREEAWRALVFIGAQPDVIVPAALDGLKSKAPGDREDALWALMYLDQLPHLASRAVENALNDPDADVRRDAADLLKRDGRSD